jgi:Cu/Zn superoxide dismutase
MRPSIAPVPALAIGITLAFAIGASATPLATSIEVRTSLSAAQEVPAPSGDVSAASGSFTGTVMKEDSGSAISWRLSYSGLTGDAVAAHIHQGRAGRAGPVVTFLCGPCQSPISGMARLDTAALAAIDSGNAYVNVHTPTNTAGEIRGQVAITAAVRTTLGARQEVPKPKGNLRRATGRFTATVTKQSRTGTITWLLRFSGLTGRAVAAHIHLGQKGRPGPVAASLCGPCRNGQRGTVKVTAATLQGLETGRAYVNIHTATNPAGEIRGQVQRVALTIS